MPLTVTSKLLRPHDMPGGEDMYGRREYDEVFEVDQTDGGADAAGVAVAIAAQSPGVGDVLPLKGANYSRHGTTDLNSYALSFNWRKPDAVNAPRRWHVGVHYGPLENTTSGQLSEPNPLQWPTEYWVEWTEEQVPVARATIVDSLDHIGRAAGTDGPIINSAGEETVNPLMKTIYYPILVAQKAYATLNEIIALNTSYQDSTNNNTFFGAPARTAKYLLTESGRLQRTQGVQFYLGVTRIWFKKTTWDLKVLNNGMSSLQKNAAGQYLGQNFPPPFDYPKLYRYMVRDLSYEANGTPIEGEWVPSSEPANLALDGTPRATDLPAIHLTYRDLAELNYVGIGIGS